MSGEDAVASGLLCDHLRWLGWSPSDLARVTGRDERILTAYMTGEQQPSLGDLIRLIEATGYEIRFRIEPRDRSDEILAAMTTPAERDALHREEQRRLTGLKAEALARQIDPDLWVDVERGEESGA